MKKFKAIGISLVAAIMFSMVTVLGASAAIPNLAKGKVVYEAKQITNVNQLETRAQQGINDDQSFKITNTKGNTLYTTQLLKETVDDNLIADSYAATVYSSPSVASQTGSDSSVQLSETINYTLYYQLDSLGNIIIHYFSIQSLVGSYTNPKNVKVSTLNLMINLNADTVNTTTWGIGQSVNGSSSRAVPSPSPNTDYYLFYYSPSSNPSGVWYLTGANWMIFTTYINNDNSYATEAIVNFG